MNGPEILARTMSVPTRSGRGKKAWQYHSRSDRHSVSELPGLLERADNAEMGHAIRERFDSLVDFEAEAERIRELLS